MVSHSKNQQIFQHNFQFFTFLQKTILQLKRFNFFDENLVFDIYFLLLTLDFHIKHAKTACFLTILLYLPSELPKN